MSEREINARRNWKAQTFPYDYYTTEPGEECNYCLTEKQAELLRGIIEPLSWRTRWWSDTDQPIDLDVIDQFRSDLTRRLMMSCCGDNPPVQFKYIDGELYRSTDGGTTFEPAEDFDIRQNPAVIFPEPPTHEGTDELCLAADSMVNLIREQIGDNLTEDMSRYTLGELIRNWVETMIGTSNPFTALVTIITNQIFALVIGAVISALTTEVYDLLKCIFYLNMASDKSFSVAAWEAIRSQILSQITGVAGVFLEHLVYLLGAGGLTNLARSEAGISDDCTGCSDGCENEWHVTGGLAIYGTIISQNGSQITVETDTINTNGVWYCDIETLDPSLGCYVNSSEVLSGSVLGIAYRTVPNSGAPGFGLGPNGACCNKLQPQSDVPFRIRFNIAQCP